jgi:hypothetical protein
VTKLKTGDKNKAGSKINFPVTITKIKNTPKKCTGKKSSFDFFFDFFTDHVSRVGTKFSSVPGVDEDVDVDVDHGGRFNAL